MSTAKIEELGELHALITQVYKELLLPREEPLMVKGEPVLDPDGMPIMRKVYPSAAELAAINAFLKNNSVTASPDQDSALTDLKKMMEERRKSRKPALPDLLADGPPAHLM